MGFFRDFHEHVRSLNSTFLVLVQKKGDVEGFRDFKPISLVRGLYKLLAKVLANRLKKVVGKVVFRLKMLLLMGSKFWMQY